jgi:hypothetical protein
MALMRIAIVAVFEFREKDLALAVIAIRLVLP